MRADIVWYRAAMAHAAWEQRDAVTENDINAVEALVLAHRRQIPLAPPPSQPPYSRPPAQSPKQKPQQELKQTPKNDSSLDDRRGHTCDSRVNENSQHGENKSNQDAESASGVGDWGIGEWGSMAVEAPSSIVQENKTLVEKAAVVYQSLSQKIVNTVSPSQHRPPSGLEKGQ